LNRLATHSMKWRIVLNLAGFGLWLATSVILLRLT
jgi:hypothetical protein